MTSVVTIFSRRCRKMAVGIRIMLNGIRTPTQAHSKRRDPSRQVGDLRSIEQQLRVNGRFEDRRGRRALRLM
jgi:hypothetical protein